MSVDHQSTILTKHVWFPWSLESYAQVEWASISEEGVDTVVAYAATPDHDIDTYQSSKAVQSDLATSTEVERTARLIKSTVEKRPGARTIWMLLFIRSYKIDK